MRPEAFHPFARLLHWLMAVLILAMLFIGVSMVADLSPRHPVLISLHKATGLALLVLVVLRIAVRLAVPHPPLPPALPTLQRWAAGASHLLLYALMLAMPLLGWAMLSAGDYPRPLGLPAIAPHNLQLYAVLRQAHGWAGYLLFATVLVHVAAALMHAWVRRDGVLRSMWPGPLRRND
ncbi:MULTISPECIES: cytochrome b [Pseudomonas]|jgi:cytochrome b561|uniref:cytochrome b n=1 Tax=Pseudomonas TaxID=286 RepID=UPI000D019A45|nr:MULTISPECIES: cytochrome b/b6 domain-containing protein [Pseudomonas]MDR2316333.1 cytochrome b/b6 domain-containing protein [Pseudomonas sp.]MDD2135772.1 cytochrome b/b6 domain-containing protein [Pseudomonas kurunegalensis]PRN02921.1 cytochrome b [Pseudomonas sp. LLC-1]PYG78549.1 cytochrome b561 [Pseudomonas sp. RV120224-01c]PYG82509.1 cytochrome b561 [Pseudomonas sp. RV120224-01b]